MAAGTTFLTKTLDQIASAAGGIGGLTARVFQGKKRFTDAQNFEALVKALTGESQGYLAVWFKSWEPGRQDIGQLGTMHIGGNLFIKLDKDTTSDCNTMYDFIVSILTAIMIASNYRGWAVSPLGVTIEETEDDYEDGIAVFEIDFEFQTPAVCGTD